MAEKIAEGQKTVGETEATTQRLVAGVEKETAGIEAQATVVEGEAMAAGEKMIAEAEAQKFRLAVEAFGNADAYNAFIFAEGLPTNVDLKLLYAGDGTLWTDTKNLSVIVPQAVPQKKVPVQRPEPPKVTPAPKASTPAPVLKPDSK